MHPSDAVVIVCAYVVGSFPVGYYLVRTSTGRDVRTMGSGSAGATNVGRHLGLRGFALTLAGDAAKGALVAWAALSWDSTWGAALGVVAVVAGHVWPFHLGLRGGKGVATALGAIAVWDIRAVAVLIAIAIGFAFVVRSFTRGGLVAVALLPLGPAAFGRPPHEQVLAGLLAAVLLVAHRHNLGTWLHEG
jgi:glycerol-3-phosphate acyltransferase PlsY